MSLTARRPVATPTSAARDLSEAGGSRKCSLRRLETLVSWELPVPLSSPCCCVASPVLSPSGLWPGCGAGALQGSVHGAQRFVRRRARAMLPRTIKTEHQLSGLLIPDFACVYQPPRIGIGAQLLRLWCRQLACNLQAQLQQRRTSISAPSYDAGLPTTSTRGDGVGRGEVSQRDSDQGPRGSDPEHRLS